MLTEFLVLVVVVFFTTESLPDPGDHPAWQFLPELCVAAASKRRRKRRNHETRTRNQSRGQSRRILLSVAGLILWPVQILFKEAELFITQGHL